MTLTVLPLAAAQAGCRLSYSEKPVSISGSFSDGAWSGTQTTSGTTYTISPTFAGNWICRVSSIKVRYTEYARYVYDGVVQEDDSWSFELEYNNMGLIRPTSIPWNDSLAINLIEQNPTTQGAWDSLLSSLETVRNESRENPAHSSVTIRGRRVDEVIVTFEIDTNPVQITTISLPSAGGTTTGGGLYLIGSTVTIVATPSAGYSFDEWHSSNGRTSKNSRHTFTVVGEEQWTASFIRTDFFAFRIHTPTSLVPTFGTANLFSGSMYQFVKSAPVIKSDDSLYVATFDIDSSVSRAIVDIGFSHSGTESIAMYFRKVSDGRITSAGIIRPNNIHVELTAASVGTIVDVYLGYNPYLYVGPGITGEDYIEVVDHQGDYSYEIPWYNSRDSANGIITFQDIDIISRLSISVTQQDLDRFRRERKVPVIVTADGVRKILNTNEIWIDFPFSNETDKTESAPRMVNKSAFIKGNPWIVIDALQEGLLFSSDSKMLLCAGDHALKCRTLGI